MSQLKSCTLVDSYGCQGSKSTVKLLFHKSKLFGSVARAAHLTRCSVWTSPRVIRTGIRLLSDESKIKRLGHAHHKHVWQQKRTAYMEKHLISTVKYGVDRSCFGASGSWALIKIDSIMNSAKHQDISAKNLVASTSSFRLDHSQSFQQDDAPNILQKLLRNTINALQWPSRCPDF